jgi:predicted PurR-regulated permease PerM
MVDDARDRRRLRPRILASLALLAGVVAVAVAMVTGLAPDLVATIATPPPLVRAGLAGLTIVLGGRLLLSAVQRIDASLRRAPGAATDLPDADLGTLVRGVRLVFLAAASFTAAGGWIVGEPLPLVIALVIAGVDVVETSFLLLVATRRQGTD